MNLLDLLDATLKEIDRQMKTTTVAKPEQMLIWTLAAQEISETKARLYTHKIEDKEKP